jgi:hypothetical protein
LDEQALARLSYPPPSISYTRGLSIIVDSSVSFLAECRPGHESGDIPMANKDQAKRKANTNQPKLTAKQKKEKKAKKAMSDRNK